MPNVLVNINSTGLWMDSGTWGLVEPNSAQFIRTNAFTPLITWTYTNAFIPTGCNVDGIALCPYNIPASLSGYFTVALVNSGDNTVVASGRYPSSNLASVVNGNEFNRPFYLFLFDNGPFSCDGTTAYKVGFITDSYATQITFYGSTAPAVSTATKFLRTNINASPSSGDRIYVLGAFSGDSIISNSVTMNNTGQNEIYGNAVNSLQSGSINVGAYGTLNWETGQNTYLRWRGVFTCQESGTVNMGTLNAPINSGYSGVLEMTCTAAGDSYLDCQKGGTINIYGYPKTNFKNYLTANVNAGATTLQIENNSGWNSGDRIAIASTSRTWSECESGYLQTCIDTTGITISPALSFGHSGVEPVKAEIANLTRNVKIFSTSPTLCGYIYCYGTMNLNNVEIYQMGSNTATKRGVYVNNNWSYFYPLVDIEYCAFRDCGVTASYSIELTQTTYGYTNHLIKNNVFYNVIGHNIFINGGLNANVVHSGLIIDNNLSMRSSTSYYAYNFTESRLTFTNNTAVGHQYGLNFVPTYGYYNFSGNVFHSCASYGIYFQPAGQGILPIRNTKIYNCNNDGLRIYYYSNATFDGIEMFGNGSRNITTVNCASDITFKNGDFDSTNLFSTTDSIYLDYSAINFTFENCKFSRGTGYKRAHTNDLTLQGLGGRPNAYSFRFINCSFGTGNTVINRQNKIASGYQISSVNQNGILGNDYIYNGFGTISPDTGIYNTASPSVRLTPLIWTSCSGYLESTRYYKTVNSGESKSCTVYVRRSVAGDGATYNGDFPTLWVEKNVNLGLSGDSMCIATGTIACSGAFEQISGNSPVTTSEGVFGYFVKCGNATTGWVNYDDFN